MGFDTHESMNISGIRSRANSSIFYDGPKGLRMNMEGNETSDLESIGLSGIDQDLSSVYKLRSKKF
jgi:hypothetical protein